MVVAHFLIARIPENIGGGPITDEEIIRRLQEGFPAATRPAFATTAGAGRLAPGGRETVIAAIRLPRTPSAGSAGSSRGLKGGA